MEKPFNSNHLFGDEVVLPLKKQFDIKHVIETGTYKGSTTLWFSDHFDAVTTVESNETYVQTLRRTFSSRKNIKLVHGDSGALLGAEIPSQGNVLFYLDAHWGAYWPLHDELRAIAKRAKGRCVIIIDDFQIPDRKDISYDEYNGKPLNWDFVKSGVKECYDADEGFDYAFYAPPADLAASRGRLIVKPK